MHSRWCMRHMGANFFKQFNSRQLMNMFKRLCKANQPTKFDELWKQLDEGTRTHIRSKQTNNNPQDVHVPQALEPMDDLIPSNGKKRRSSKNIKCFTHWIECEPNDKWALLHDTNGARHGIMTTNLAEAYNAVLHKLRPLPLTAFVEGIMHRTTMWMRTRRAAALQQMSNAQTPFCKKMAEYLQEKANKARFLTDRVLNAWSAEILGWRYLQHLVDTRGDKRIYVPDLDLLKVGKGRRQTRRLRNDMDASEAGGPVRRCEDCLQYGHRTRDCKNNKEDMEEEWPYPLLSKEIDARHRAKKISDGNSCSSQAVLIPRTAGWCGIDPRWKPRLSAADLLTFVQMMQARMHYDAREPKQKQMGAHSKRRQNIDKSLLMALVDRWRPETHTFHLPCGEMTITLQDVSMLTGLPLAGQAIVLPDSPEDWRDDIVRRPYMSVAVAHKDDYTDAVDDRPTFGTRWCYGPPQWARIQVHNVYEYFTEAFESLRENVVRWTPYTNEEAILRAPHGVSVLCYRDEAYWMTRKMLVYDIFFEGEKRQADNRYHRSMHSRMTPWIEAWSQALNDVVQETKAYDHNTYEQYKA
uniref:Aminotransferase-like plant mobile domain-containing protein n=1 Tax=Oryza meridionalis TaxID=40149 RepID=A0A0E0DB97_9ORYZ